MIFLAYWIGCLVFVGWVAHTRNRSVVGWVALGTFFNWMALLALVALPKREAAEAGTPGVRWFPHPPRTLFWIAQGLWAAFCVFVTLGAILGGDYWSILYADIPLWLAGAALITTLNYGWRKLRHFRSHSTALPAR